MTFNYYRAGQINGQGPIIYIIRFLRSDGSFGSCECIEEDKLEAELNALVTIGWRFAAD